MTHTGKSSIIGQTGLFIAEIESTSSRSGSTEERLLLLWLMMLHGGIRWTGFGNNSFHFFDNWLNFLHHFTEWLHHFGHFLYDGPIDIVHHSMWLFFRINLLHFLCRFCLFVCPNDSLLIFQLVQTKLSAILAFFFFVNKNQH